MYNANKPSVDELPSSAQLLRSTIIAISAAAALLITTVLPSEYGIDPTGVGRILGLTEMGEIKTQLAEEAEADRRLEAQTQAEATIETAPSPQPVGGETIVANPLLQEQPTTVVENTPEAAPEVTQVEAEPAAQEPAPIANSDEVSITLTPGQGAEIKLVMKGGAKARFEWTANGSVLNYDTHGNGGGQRISYEKGRAVPGDEGVLEAAFDGNHGWFWRNRTDADVTMTLRTEGDYLEMKRVL